MAHVWDKLNEIVIQELQAFDAGWYQNKICMESRMRLAVQAAWEDGFVAAMNGEKPINQANNENQEAA